MYQLEVNIKVPQMAVVTTITCGALLLLALGLKEVKWGSFKGEQIEFTEAMTIDLPLTAEMNAPSAPAQGIMVAKDTIFNEPNPDLLIFQIKNQSKITANALSSFLNGLGSTSFSTFSSSDIKTSARVASAGKPTTGNVQEQTINYAAMAPQKEAAKVEAKEQIINHNELKKMIAAHQKSFQQCYENSLLKDDLLSGNATVLLKIGGKADVSFKGIGKEVTKSELRNCLSHRAVAMNFSNEYQGKSVRFSLFFNN